jgi:hypothetical protein
MRDALQQADRTLALVSAAYLASPYCTDEWTRGVPARFRRLEPPATVRIEDCELPRLLRAQVYIDLVGRPHGQARARLLAEVRRGAAQAIGRTALPARPSRAQRATVSWIRP